MKSKKFIHTTISEYLNEQNININDNFKKWFGNSKVVDENGVPLVVNHGNRTNFSIFSKRNDENSNDIASMGFWFSSSKDFGKTFANNIWYGEENDVVVYHVYLSIKKPKIYVSDIIDENILKNTQNAIKNIEDEIIDISSNYNTISLHQKQDYKTWKYENEAFELASNGNINNTNKDVYVNRTENSKNAIQDGLKVLKLENRLKKIKEEYYNIIYSDSYEKLRTDIYKITGKNAEDANVGGIGKNFKDKKETIKKYVDLLKSDGYDGIIIKNTRFDKKYAGGLNDQYMVFNSNQIKSVDNDGSQDQDDDNIYS